MSANRRPRPDAARRAASIALVAAVWQAVVLTGWVPEAYFPGVPQVAGAAADLARDAGFWRHEGLTLARAGGGCLVAIALALGLALAAVRHPVVGRALAPLVELFRSMPPAPLVPLAIFALGLGLPLYLFIIVFACVWVVYVGASAALATAEPLQVQSARSVGLDEGQILWRVRLPAALPEIFASIRLAAGVSLLAAIAAEMLAGRDGLGAMLFDAAFALRTPETFALLLVAGLNGMAFNALVVAARRPLAGWHDGLAASHDH